MKMKVKGEFLGLGAKLAAALLVFCGTTLVGCYSENDDVAIPYVESDPIYTITGVAMDATGKPLSGVQVSVQTASTKAVVDITTTGTNGLYSISSKNNNLGKRIDNTATPNVGANTVIFTYNGKTYTFTVNLDAGSSGGASIGTQNVVIAGDYAFPDDVLPTYTLNETSTQKAFVHSSTTEPDLYIVNDNDSKKDYSLTLILPEGTKYQTTIDAAFASAPSNAKEALVAYAKETIGDITDEVLDKDYLYSFDLPARSYLNTLTVNAIYATKTYTFAYKSVNYVVKFTKYGAYTFSREYASWDHSHGQGHGHGHGEDYNAGGGIVDGVN